MAKGSRSLRHEEIEPKPKIGELTLSAFEARRRAVCGEVINSRLTVSDNIDLGTGHFFVYEKTTLFSKYLT